MGSLFISDFKYGMDRRRQKVAGVPGTLWLGKNALINRGGDIETPKAFVPMYSLSAGQTFGLASVGGQIYVFGSIDPSALTTPIPNGVQYQRLVSAHGAGDAMVQVLDVQAADGKLYVIAKYASGNIYHFYGGTRVTDWDALATTNGNAAALAVYLADVVNADANVAAIASGPTITVTANVPGTAFAISKSVVGAGTIHLATVQPNVVAVPETVATGDVTITGGSALNGVNRVNDVMVNGVSLMLASVDWVLSNAATASEVATQINNKTATHHYSAAAVGADITISAGPGTGATPNGFVISPQLIGNVTATTTAMSGGVTAVAAIAQIATATIGGTYSGTDQYTLTINGTAYTTTGNASGTGKSLYLTLQRLWSPATSLEQYSKLDTFNNWSDASPSSGAGFINLSNDAEGSEPLVGAGTYISQTAIFSRRNCRIYNLDADATSINLAQSIDNTGARASRSILAYGTTDLFYLDETGWRSLKARDASGAAFVNDLGTAIDAFVVPNMNALPNGVVQRACAVVEPLDGRFWGAIGPYIYVLSYFPGSQISAWTYLDPGFSVSDFARAYNRLYVRSGDTIYLYGGTNGSTYPRAGELVTQIDLPFAATQPPGFSMFTGFDMAGSGEWEVKVYLNPDEPTIYQDVGIVDGTTYTGESNSWPARATHAAPSLTCSAGGFATISNMTLWHDGKEPNE